MKNQEPSVDPSKFEGNPPRPKLQPRRGKIPPPQKGPDSERRRLIAFLVVPLIFFVMLQIFVLPKMEMNQLSYSVFYEMLINNPSTGEIESAELVETTVRGKLKDG